MRNNGRAMRLLRMWREDYIGQTLMSAAASSAMIYVVIVSITVRMLRKGLSQTATHACGKQT